MKDRQDVIWKKLDEEIKAIADVERSIFATFLATVLATININNRLVVGLGIALSLLLFILYVVLVIVRQQKIKEYE